MWKVNLLAFALTVLPPIGLYFASFYIRLIGVVFYLASAGIGTYFIRTVPSSSEMRARCVAWARKSLPPPTPLTPFGIAFTLLLLNQVPREEIVDVYISKGREKTYRIKVFSYLVFVIGQVCAVSSPVNTLSTQPNKESHYFSAVGIAGNCYQI